MGQPNAYDRNALRTFAKKPLGTPPPMPHEPQAFVRNDQPECFQTPAFHVFQKTKPAFMIFLGTFTNL
jgi:hypothetical protein